MRITIDIDGETASAATTSGQLATPAGGTDVTDASVPTATDEASAAVVARRTGAVNAGAAPAGPGLPTSGSEQSSATPSDTGAAWSGAAESAGAAPTERG